jgi:hypothetical protein
VPANDGRADRQREQHWHLLSLDPAVSVCLPAWILGRNPCARIICASYSEDLAHKFSRDCRALMDSTFYKRVFGRTRFNPKKSTETEFETTRRGHRLATSVGGALTGRGGDILIIDDPTKAHDANSEVALTGAEVWFHDTALNRLDSADSIAIVTMQRLHQKDLSGILIEKGWPHLAIPAVATETRTYAIAKDETYTRPAGELLQPQRDTPEEYKAKEREIGSRLWGNDRKEIKSLECHGMRDFLKPAGFCFPKTRPGARLSKPNCWPSRQTGAG